MLVILLELPDKQPVAVVQVTAYARGSAWRAVDLIVWGRRIPMRPEHAWQPSSCRGSSDAWQRR